MTKHHRGDKGPVSLEESTEDTHPEDPQGLLASPGVLGSLPLT